MRIGIGIPNTRRAVTAGAPPSPLGWIADLLASGGTVFPGAAGNFETGVKFTQLSSAPCRGIRALWNNPAVGAQITFNLWKSTGTVLVATETVAPVANGYLQTSPAFGSWSLVVGDQYAVTIVVPGLYNQFAANPMPMPKTYADAQVDVGYAYAFGVGYPGVDSPGYGSFVEPMY
jgi:hypothetical protein